MIVTTTSRVFLLLSLLVVVVLLVASRVVMSGASDSFMLRWLLVGGVLALCIYWGLGEPSLLNPYLLFSLAPLSLLLYDEKVSAVYLNALRVDTVFLAFINMIVFVVVFRLTERHSKKWMQVEGFAIDRLGSDGSGLLVKHFWILMGLSLVPMVYRSVSGSALMFGSVMGLFFYPALVCAWKARSLRLIVAAYLAVLLSFLGGGFDKSAFLAVSMVSLLCYERYYLVTRRQKWNLLVSVALLVGLLLYVAFPLKDWVRMGGSLGGFFSITGRGDGASISDFYGERIAWGGENALRIPYMYLVTPWNNLQYVMQTQDFRSYGLWFLKPVLGWVQLDGYFESSYHLEPFSSFNTFTYIAVLFKDFGYWGSLIGATFLGYFVKKVYIRYLHSNSVFDTACYSLTACATLEMFFSNHFFMQSYPFTVILACYTYQKVTGLNERI